MEDVILPNIMIVEEAPLKATDAGVVAVGLMETVVLLGLRTLLGSVSMLFQNYTIYLLEPEEKGRRTCQ
jgi:hypothetical protein